MKRGTIRHPKTDALMDSLNINRAEVLGILTMLWDWAGQYAPLGDIGKFSNRTIARAVEWPEVDADKLIQAMMDIHWIDEVDPPDRLVIHDWIDHREQWVEKRLDRLKQEKNRKGYPLDIQNLSNGRTAHAHAHAPAIAPAIAHAHASEDEHADDPTPHKSKSNGDGKGNGSSNGGGMDGDGMGMLRNGSALEKCGIGGSNVAMLSRLQGLTPQIVAATFDDVKKSGAKNPQGATVARLKKREWSKP